MAEPVLDQPRVVAGIGQGVAAGVAQHVGVDPKRQLGPIANGFHEAINCVSRKWTAALGFKDESTRVPVANLIRLARGNESAESSAR
jgi:hypothetical protein